MDPNIYVLPAIDSHILRRLLYTYIHIYAQTHVTINTCVRFMKMIGIIPRIT